MWIYVPLEKHTKNIGSIHERKSTIEKLCSYYPVVIMRIWMCVCVCGYSGLPVNVDWASKYMEICRFLLSPPRQNTLEENLRSDRLVCACVCSKTLSNEIRACRKYFDGKNDSGDSGSSSTSAQTLRTSYPNKKLSLFHIFFICTSFYDSHSVKHLCRHG